jgi:hypothetical protein
MYFPVTSFQYQPCRQHCCRENRQGKKLALRKHWRGPTYLDNDLISLSSPSAIATFGLMPLISASSSADMTNVSVKVQVGASVLYEPERLIGVTPSSTNYQVTSPPDNGPNLRSHKRRTEISPNDHLLIIHSKLAS